MLKAKVYTETKQAFLRTKSCLPFNTALGSIKEQLLLCCSALLAIVAI